MLHGAENPHNHTYCWTLPFIAKILDKVGFVCLTRGCINPTK
jgi:hypothetical protein